MDAPTFAIMEQASGRFTAVLTDNDGVTPVPGPTLTLLHLTLYVIKADGSLGIVNGRNQQNVLNANNVTIDALGSLVWLIQPGDTTLVEAALPFERHVALWEWSWPQGSGKREIVLVVQNLTTVI